MNSHKRNARLHGTLDAFILECFESNKYRADSAGAILCRDARRGGANYSPIKASRNSEGYRKVRLELDGIVKGVYVHRVVAIFFLGLPPDRLYEVNHIDGDKAHNARTNLEWVDRSGNTEHAYALGLKKTVPAGGVKNANASLTESMVLEIRRRAASGEKQSAIAADYGVSQVCISLIHRRKTWPDIGPPA